MHHPPTESLVDAIKLSITPVFLLVGISSIIGIITGRFSRAIDHYKSLSEPSPSKDDEQRLAIANELTILKRRLFLLLRAIQLLTFSLAGTALVVTLIFIGTITLVDLTHITAVLFFTVMLFISIAAFLFLRDVQLAMAYLTRFTNR